MSTTPRLDAWRKWREAGDLSAPIAWPAEDYNPAAGLNDEQLGELIIRTCASGAPAELPIRYVVINGRRIPPPPAVAPVATFHHSKRNHAPRPRSRSQREVSS